MAGLSAGTSIVLRANLGSKLLIVTPGIRPGANISDNSDDQKRIVSAREAIAEGADYIVVGRPISKAVDPLVVITLLEEGIRAGLEQRNE